MDGLVTAALALGGLALLRQAAGLALLLRYLRRARVRSIPKGPTPPLSVVAAVGRPENLTALLRQNYPDFEVILPAPAPAAEEVPDVAVRVGGEPRHELVVTTAASVRPDPLYLRDAANGLAEADVVEYPPVLFGMTAPLARLAGLLADTDGLFTVLLSRGAVTSGASRAERRGAAGRRTLARRAARVHAPGGLRDALAAAPHLRHWSYVPLSLAPALLLVAAFAAPAAIWMLAAHTLVRLVAAILVDFRFCWDRSLVRALPLLPLLWALEPALCLGGLARAARGALFGLLAAGCWLLAGGGPGG